MIVSSLTAAVLAFGNGCNSCQAVLHWAKAPSLECIVHILIEVNCCVHKGPTT